MAAPSALAALRLPVTDGGGRTGIRRASTRRSARTTGPAAALVMRTDQVFRRCLADSDLMADAYETLAADYDWLFDDDALSNGGAINQPAAAI